ncbi:hypothetical protein EDD63_1494 [Breznakia blatticola]|uniref:Cof subfamily protein (Haloacid dehalogenase superfamily)/HAD superfamily hydrolase (TIGR01484 family) n=1 Tax=Breznakia blatticola TaxID=1754012 RepID=A0A4R7ZCC8_9FIRM|nr:HAD family hydrolase [Breznakia blatticola]TDW13114.1 hypothetical protein EDD63_1494 [Breznakia blatticola]
MKDIKIIFFDIDGTLIDMQRKQISEHMLYTLRKLKENGIVICIATGRSPISLPHFEGIDFDAYLTFNGSYCYNEKETIFKNPIDPNDVKVIVDNAKNIARPVSVSTIQKNIANGKDDDLVEYFSFAHQEVYVSTNFDEEIHNEDVYQLMVSATPKEYDVLMKHTNHTKITAWWNRAVDIIPANGGKGKGIEEILAYYGFDASQAMAFGDGNNDIEMLQTVGWGLAMENASDDLKEIANEIIGHVSKEGIYHYCVKQGFIEAK